MSLNVSCIYWVLVADYLASIDPHGLEIRPWPPVLLSSVPRSPV
jgi:hypothetical protein